MTVQQDVKRAGLRAMMAESMLGVPEYSADPKVLSRVGNVIGGTASHEERHVRDERQSYSLNIKSGRAGASPQWLVEHLAVVRLNGHVVLYSWPNSSAGLLAFRVAQI
jgi:hypothetical protein